VSEITAPTGRYGGRAADARVTERRARLVAAGIELLGTGGTNAATMRAVVRAAKLSPRYYYESFPDQAAFVRAVYDAAAERVQRAALAALDADAGGHDPAAKLRAAFGAAAALFEDDPRLGRIMFRETLVDAALRRHAVTAVEPLLRAFAARVLEDSGARLREDAVADLDLAARAATGVLVVLFLDWLDGRLDVDRARLVDYCAAVTLRILPLEEDPSR
jgi:AcrR family transcriptional regulator